MTSQLGSWFGGGRRRVPLWFGTPYSSDMWDPDNNEAILIRDQERDHDHEITNAFAHAHVDWQETQSSHVFQADLPGVRKEQVKVHVEDGNVLQISGERTQEEEDASHKWHRVERRRGSFVRRFRLPENANLEEIKCVLDHGVLTVTVPKKNVEEEIHRIVRFIDVD